MRSIRFSDQVNGATETSRTRFRNRRNSYAEGGITYGGRRGHDSMAMRDLSSSRSLNQVPRRNSDRSLNTYGNYSRPPPSIAASDTSSAAGFIPHRNSVLKHGSLTRGYAVDKSDIGLYSSPSLYERQDYLSDIDHYRDGPGSAATSSPFSQRSVDSSSNYNQSTTSGGTVRPASTTPHAMPRDPILKNGTMPRSTSRASSYRYNNNTPGKLSKAGSVTDTTDHHKRPLRPLNTYSNGTLNRGNRPNQNNNGLTKKSSYNSIETNSIISRDVIRNPMVRRDDTAGLPLLPRPSNSVQIVATPHKPCFDCSCLRRRQHESDIGGAKSTPICVLFAIFLVFSLTVVSGVMLYLRGGYVSSLLSNSSSKSSSSKHHTALSTKRCDEGLCGFGGVCVDSPNGGGSRCHCENNCPFVYKPVCGSDSVTYDSECRLKLAACKRKRNIKKVHEGECGKHDPCEQMSCPKYSSCVPSFDGMSASCQCPTHCPEQSHQNEDFQPVCGTNGKDYLSECHLEKEACDKRLMDLRVRYHGRCNPCQFKTCDLSKNEECHVVAEEDLIHVNSVENTPFDLSSDDTKIGRVAECRCEPNCPEEFRPVCGSNGKTYRNECNMKLDSCRRHLNLHAVYLGNCSSGLNQCEVLKCEFGQECLTSKQGISACVCPLVCERIVRPVCGSDGKTYDNECEMRRQACYRNVDITAKFIGVCDSKGPCSKRVCNHHSICVESDDLAFCECPKCSQIYEPVCGSDGKSYDNECMLRQTACRKETSISIVERGPCTGCANVTCDFYSICTPKHEVISQKPIGECVCPTSCDQLPDGEKDNIGVVCGTDGNTYDSACQMKIQACEKKQNVVVANVGYCDLCRGVSCKHGARCENGICVCPTDCPQTNNQPICATDMLSYSNECEMLKRSCQTGISLTVLHSGYCSNQDTNDFVSQACECSPYGSVKLDCEGGTGRCVCKDGILGEKCDLCPDGSPVTRIGCEELYFPYGMELRPCGSKVCEFGARCIDDLHCSCDIQCPPYTKLIPVCGSDGQTYNSECELINFVCNYQTHIMIKKYHPCPVDQFINPYPDIWSTSTTEPSSFFQSTRRHVISGVTDSSSRSSNRYLDNQRSFQPTQETTIVVFGLIGDLCLFDKDCTVQNSVCDNRKCVCAKGYQWDKGGQICSYDYDNELSIRGPCTSSPCQGGGTCEEHDGTFTCFCTSDRIGEFCEKSLANEDLSIPSFDGVNSYVMLKTMQGVKHKFSLEIEFLAYNLEGVMMFSGQQGPGKDFILLELNDGYVRFVYNLGSGEAEIISRKRITLGHWHRISAKRWHKDGTLKVDHHSNVMGQSQGAEKSLDITEPAYIGQNSVLTPDRPGFHGCIKRFKLGYREIKIQTSSEPLVLSRIGLQECGTSPCATFPCKNKGKCSLDRASNGYLCTCSPPFEGQTCETFSPSSATAITNPCLSSPCLEGGTCLETKEYVKVPKGGTKWDNNNVDYVCNCPPGRKGRFCELKGNVQNDNSVFVPAFGGRSFLELPTLKHISKAFQIEVWFLTYSTEGMILFNGQNPNGDGDFLSINLVQGFVQFRYDLGGGYTSLSSKEKVKLDEWHRVKATRDGKLGTLQLDDGPIVTGSAPGTLKELNLEMPLYLGGFRFSYFLGENSGISVGLNGAIQRLIVNGNPIENLMDYAKNSENVAKYLGPPCDDNPCLNGGLCKPLLSSFMCKCRPNFRGLFCEKELKSEDERAPIKFDGRTFLSFTNKLHKIRKGEGHNKFAIQFRTVEPDGLLLWSHEGATLNEDFLAIAIVKGYPELSFNLGKQKQLLRITGKKKVNDGKWHKLKVVRKKRIGIIQIDKQRPERGKSEKGATVLNTDGKLWIGGKNSLPSGLPLSYYQGFQGCLKRIKVFKKKLNIHREASSLELCGN